MIPYFSRVCARNTPSEQQMMKAQIIIIVSLLSLGIMGIDGSKRFISSVVRL